MTGESHTVGELVEAAFGYAELDWRKHVRQDWRYLRPAEADHLCGDASRARTDLNWAPTVTFTELVRMMTDADWQLARQERLLSDAGHVLPLKAVADM